MGNDRINKWLSGFYDYVKGTNPELLPLYDGRIMFFPQDDENVLHPALNELPERYATKEQIKQMLELIETYSKEHDV